MSGEFPGSDTPQLPEPALLFTGEGVAALLEHRELLRQVAGVMAGGHAIEVSVITDLAPIGAEGQPEPVPATRDDLRQFAKEHGYTDQRACRAWGGLVYTAYRWYSSDPEWRFEDSYPRLTFLDPVGDLESAYAPERRRGYQMLDLRSVHARLAVPDYPMQRFLWDRMITLNALGFLAHLVNERVRPDELLPIDPKEIKRQQG